MDSVKSVNLTHGKKTSPKGHLCAHQDSRGEEEWALDGNSQGLDLTPQPNGTQWLPIDPEFIPGRK